LKIKEIKVLVCSPGRNFVTVKIITDNGIYGLGDATVNGREMAVAAYLTEHVAPCLIGRDAHMIEDIWQCFAQGKYPLKRYKKRSPAQIKASLGDRLGALPTHPAPVNQHDTAIDIVRSTGGQEYCRTLEVIGHTPPALGYTLQD